MDQPPVSRTDEMEQRVCDKINADPMYDEIDSQIIEVLVEYYHEPEDVPESTST